MSVLSVHMGLEGLCQQRKASLSLDNMEKQDGPMATGGRCITLVRAVVISLLPVTIMALKINHREECFFLSECRC